MYNDIRRGGTAPAKQGNVMKKSEIVSRAYARHIRVSARKVRLVIDLIRGQGVPGALAILTNLNKRAKVCVGKALKSAVSNALQNPLNKVEDLFISKITADNGPMLKRFRAATMGRATMIKHRSTHIAVELSKYILPEKAPSDRKKIIVKTNKLTSKKKV